MAIVFEPLTAEQQWAIQELHHDWATQQIAQGVDGPVPAGRPDPSDYNQHVPDMEASGAALDTLFDGISAILAS